MLVQVKDITSIGSKNSTIAQEFTYLRKIWLGPNYERQDKEEEELQSTKYDRPKSAKGRRPTSVWGNSGHKTRQDTPVSSLRAEET